MSKAIAEESSLKCLQVGEAMVAIEAMLKRLPTPMLFKLVHMPHRRIVCAFRIHEQMMKSGRQQHLLLANPFTSRPAA